MEVSPALGAGAHKTLEEVLATRLVHFFWMPLHTDLPSSCTISRRPDDALDRFYHAVGATRDDPMIGARRADGLMVEAIDQFCTRSDQSF